jgi:hypothetical protein
MTAVDPFLIPVPEAFMQDGQTASWAEYLHRWNHDMWVRTGGGTDTIQETETVVLSHSEKLDLLTITQEVNLDTVESDTAANTSLLATIASSSPTYAPSNDGTDRTWDANAAAGAITSPPTQAEVENIRDAVLELSDVVATLVRDLAAKTVLDT